MNKVKLNWLTVLAICAVIWQPAVAADCPDGKPGSPGYTLRIEYAEHWEGLAAAYRKEGAPPSVRGPEKSVLIVRDDYEWMRDFGKDWAPVDPNPDQPRIDALQARIDEMMDANGDPEVLAKLMHRLNQLMANPHYAAKRSDNISVHAPGWDFDYDNVAKEGRKTVRDIPLTTKSVVRAANSMGLRNPIAGRLKHAGRVINPQLRGKMSIAGYTCKLYASEALGGAQYCIANVGGQDVVLYNRFPLLPGGPVIEKAVKVEPGVCVGLKQFAIPMNVRWLD